jgi:hypothetical protein
MTERDPSIAFGDSWWSTIAVQPASSASSVEPPVVIVSSTSATV